MRLQLMFVTFLDVGVFGLFYGLVLAGVIGKTQSQNQMAASLRRFANLSAIAFGVILAAGAVLGDAWKNNWFDYQNNVNLFRATSYAFLVVFMAIFVVGALRVSWADRLLIAVVFGGVLLMEGLFYPVPYLMKVVAMLAIIAVRVIWLLNSSRKA